MQNCRIDLPATLITGGGSRSQLGSLAKELGGNRVLLVTDPGVIALGLAEEVADILNKSGLVVAIFSDVQADPTEANVAAGVEAARAHQADLIVALGGGSPIDTAKVIAIRPTNPEPLSDFMGLHRIRNAGVPLIAVPTTAGTGSEATRVAVITDTERQIKMMMMSAPLLPRVAVVDFELSMSMPRPLTAAVGVDTLTHGIEAYVSGKANAMSDPIALSCIRLVGRYLRRAWNNPDDREARGGMMLAACQGGMAFSNSSVCLVHGMSRPIGAVFHLPHGLSNAVLLPTITQFTWPAAINRYAEIARTLGVVGTESSDTEACRALVDSLSRLNHDLDLPRLSRCQNVRRGRFDQQVEKMARDALASGSPANNPRVPSHDEIVDLYRQAW